MATNAVMTQLGLTASLAQAYFDAQAHNVLQRVPFKQVGPPSLVDGPLKNTTGGRQSDLTKPPCLSVFLGPHATLRGVVVDLISRTRVSGHGPQNPYDELLAVQGVYVFNHTYLEALPTPAWLVGLWLPMPIEVSSAGTWTSQWDAVMAWAGTFNPARWAALDTPAAALALPNPDILPADLTAWLAGKDLGTVAEALAGQIVANPFEAVFRIYEIFRQLPSTGSRSQSAVAIELLNRLTDRELDLVASVTAGNGILRRVWTAISSSTASGAANARDRLGPALGLAGSSGSWQHWTSIGPSVVPDELPLRVNIPNFTPPAPPPAASNPAPLTAEDPNGVHEIVLGRDVCVGNTTAYSQANKSTWSGPSYIGRMQPTVWAQTHASALGLSTAQEQARLNIVLKIAGNEAYLDGSRAADKGMLSTGIQQWSAHLNEELPPLLERFRLARPDLYELFFGLYGLQSALWARTGPNPGDSEAATTPSSAAIRRDNPDAFVGTTAKTDPKEFGVGYATLGVVAPSAAWTLLPQPPDTVTALNPRHVFFGAHTRASGQGYQIEPTWCARVRLATLCSTEYGLSQIWTGVYRLDRLRRQAGTVNVDGVGYGAAELLSSEFAAAAALDEHINAPWQVAGSLERAAKRTSDSVTAATNAGVPSPMLSHDPPTTAQPHPPLQSPWLAVMAVNYLAVRLRPPAVKSDTKRARDATLLSLHDQAMTAVPPTGLSAQPGSFGGW